MERTPPRRWVAITASLTSLAATGLACELTTDLDKLRGPGGAGAGTSAGSGGAGGSAGAAAGAPGNGGTANSIVVIPYVAADMLPPNYDGRCTERVWTDAKKYALTWEDAQIGVGATCTILWGDSSQGGAGGTPAARRIYGCCQVTEPEFKLAGFSGGDCHPYNDDGISYIFVDKTSQNEKTTVVLSAWGSDCPSPAEVTVDTANDSTPTKPTAINKCAPGDMEPTCLPMLQGNGPGFGLEWALDLEGEVSRSDAPVFCSLAVRASSLSSNGSGAKLGILNIRNQPGISSPAQWSTCVFGERSP